MATSVSNSPPPSGSRSPPGPNPFKASATPGNTSATAIRLFGLAEALAFGKAQLPNVPALGATLDRFEAGSDGSPENTREINEAREKLRELQKIIDLVNAGIEHLDPKWGRALLRELFAGHGLQAHHPDTKMLQGVFAELESSLFDRSVDDIVMEPVGEFIAAMIAGDQEVLSDLVLGRLDDGGDYHPGSLSLEDLQSVRENLEAKLQRVYEVEGMEGLGPRGTDMTDTVGWFNSASFLEGYEYSVAGEDGQPETASSHVFPEDVALAMDRLETWVDSLDEDKAEIMRELFARLPGVVTMINDALNVADPGQAAAYVGAFLGSSAKIKFHSDNAELNALNVGKLLAAVLAGDKDALGDFLDDFDMAKLEESFRDFTAVEGEFRSVREIRADDDDAAKEFYRNTVQPALQSTAGASEQEEETA